MSGSKRVAFAAIVTLGVLIRLALLIWVSPLELWADEGQYIYQAIAWNRFGFYLGSTKWVWPPGYPAFLALFFRWFEDGGLFAAKLVQVLLSGVIGASVMVLARRLFSWRASWAAGLLWAVYLPLIGFTHYLWPETVFLALLVPAVCLFHRGLEGEPGGAGALAVAGALIGGTCLFKEAALPLLGFLPVLLLLSGRGHPLPERALQAAGLVLGALVVIVPWSLRTHEVYGHVVPSGATLGENMYQGVNADYINYDYAGGVHLDHVDDEGLTYRWFVQIPEGAEKWQRSEHPNPIQRNQESVARGKAFMREYPGFYARSRVKKLADWVTPLNFFQRQLRLGIYRGSIERRWARWPIVIGSVGLTAFTMIASLGGLFLALRRARDRWLMISVIGTFLAGILVVSMSRYRVQVEPFLLVLAAGFLTSRPWRTSSTARRLAILAWAVLAVLWLLNAGEILRILRLSLR